jgi:hypothetical protein
MNREQAKKWIEENESEGSLKDGSLARHIIRSLDDIEARLNALELRSAKYGLGHQSHEKE